MPTWKDFPLWSSLLCLACLLCSAQPRPELERYRRQLSELHRSIEQLRQQLENTERQQRSLQLRIAQLRQYSQLLQRSIELTTLALRRLEDSLQLLQKELARLGAQQDTIDMQQRQLLTSFYRWWHGKESDTLRPRLEFFTRQLLLHYRHRSHHLTQQRDTIERLRLRLSTLQQQRTDWLRRRQQQQAELTQTLQRQQQLLNSLRNRQQELRRLLRQRQQSAQRLQQLIAQLQAEASRRKPPPSPPPSPSTSQPLAPKSLPWPSSSRRLLRGYGLQRNPETGVVWNNPGIDIATAAGSPVYAVAAGTVKLIQWLPTYQYVVVLEHANDLRSVYANLETVAVSLNSSVSQGTLVGTAGRTPDGEGFHFQLWKGRQRLNPLEWLR